MPKAKIAITLDSRILAELDELVRGAAFPNRSHAIEVAVAEKIGRLTRGRLARECARLDPTAERAVAEEGLTEGAGDWSEY